jgi:hypothetical protein
MKIKVILGSLAMIATSVVFVSMTPANAGECTAEDPCQTYALVNDAGYVYNTIVCQPSECGSGYFGREKVVLQIPANPQTNTPAETGQAYNSNDNQVVQVIGNTFTVTDRNTEEVITTITPAFNIQKNEDVTTVNSVLVEFPLNDSATVVMNSKEVTNQQTTTDTLKYYAPQTEAKVLEDLDNGLKILRKNYAWFRQFLTNWFVM